MSHRTEDSDQSMHSHSEEEEEEEVVTTTTVAAPSLYQRPSFFRRTRQKGKILKTVQERYLRDDLGLGCYYWDPQARKRRKGAEHSVGKPKPIETVHQLMDLLVVANNKKKQHTSLVVVDTNVLLHNLDVLEQAIFTAASPNFVIPQTALEECRAQQMTVYDQAVELLRSVGGTTTTTSSSSSNNTATADTAAQKSTRCGIFFPDQHHVETQVTQRLETNSSNSNSSINDVNDARLRKVALYYGTQLQNTKTNTDIQVIFLTDDADSKAKAIQEQQALLLPSSKNKNSKLYYQPMTVKQWVQELEKNHPEIALMDYVAHYGGTTTTTTATTATTINSPTNQHQHQNHKIYPAHVSAPEVSRGLAAGQYHRGVFRSTEDYTQKGKEQQGVITIRKGDERVAITIHGWDDRNRAMDGYVVLL